MNDGELMRVLFDQITEGQVTWIPMDKDYDKVSVIPSFVLNPFTPEFLMWSLPSLNLGSSIVENRSFCFI